jgi:hypothetical protein
MAAASFLRLVILASSLALAACGSGNSDTAETVAASPDTPVMSEEEPPPPADGAAMAMPVGPSEPADCNADRAARFVGRTANPGVRAEIAEAVAPITAIRWVGPGDATTEDYSPQRLNIMLDAGDVIVSAHCG